LVGARWPAVGLVMEPYKIKLMPVWPTPLKLHARSFQKVRAQNVVMFAIVKYLLRADKRLQGFVFALGVRQSKKNSQYPIRLIGEAAKTAN
jgi:hypothetical protein